MSVADLAQAELQRRILGRESIAGFFQLREPDYHLGAWLVDLFANLEWMYRTPGANLMIFAPPRHGKSTVVSRILPAYWLGRRPRSEVIAASATQELADEFGLYVRDTMNDPLYKELYPRAALHSSSNSVGHMVLQAGGGYRTVGVGSQIVGRGAGLLIVDDPYKDRAQAYSANERKKLEAWWRTSARTRLAPGGNMVLMHQRWHHEDLAATLLRVKEDSKADQWRVLSYPAYAEAGDRLGRPEGAPLFPEFWPYSALEKLKATMLEEEWLALYQQRPTKLEGGFFKAEWFQWYSQLPEKLVWYIGVDFAASTASYADRTAIMPIGIDGQGNWYLAPDFVCERLESLDAVRRLIALCKKYRPVKIATEKGVLDRVLRPLITSEMRAAGVYVTIEGIVRDVAKHIIAAPLQARMQQRAVWFPNNRLMQELVRPAFLDFMPDADNKVDDPIDGMANLAQLLHRLRKPVTPPPPREVSDAEAEEAQWARIQGRRPSGSVGLTRLNGDPYRKRT